MCIRDRVSEVAKIVTGSSFAALAKIAYSCVVKNFPITSLSNSAFRVPTTEAKPIGMEKTKTSLIIVWESNGLITPTSFLIHPNANKDVYKRQVYIQSEP